MTYRLCWTLLGLQLLALLIGTQMPEAWRSGIMHTTHALPIMSSLGHFVLFAGMSTLLAMRPLALPVWRVVSLALALALITEGLQFFAIDRHPRWIDVTIDLAGAVLGVGLVNLVTICFTRP